MAKVATACAHGFEEYLSNAKVGDKIGSHLSEQKRTLLAKAIYDTLKIWNVSTDDYPADLPEKMESMTQGELISFVGNDVCG